MAGVASKNLFDVLGNDPELDPDRAPEPPTKAIDKSAPRTGKRNAGPEAPSRDARPAAAAGRRQDNATGNELAYRDRNAGRDQNRSKPSEEGGHRGDRGSGYRGRGRGGGGGRGGRGGGGGARDDRHSKTGVADHEKQAAHGWGGQTGPDELADEKAGDAIAKEEQKDEGAEAAAAEAEAEPEPEDKTISYAAWQAEQENKRAALGGSHEVRQANEGSSKKFPEGKAISRDEDDDAYIAGSGGKKKRERERKEKTLVELDNPKMYDQPREHTGRGGRGGRGRGEFRGGESRGRGGGGRGRGGDDSGRGRGEFRGGRGGRGGQGGPNVDDQRAFPSLGA